MRHNLFSHPTEVIIRFLEDGSYKIDNILEAQNLIDILDDIDYDTGAVTKKLKSNIEESTLIDESQKQNLLGKLYLYLSENSYLKTIQAIKGQNA